MHHIGGMENANSKRLRIAHLERRLNQAGFEAHALPLRKQAALVAEIAQLKRELGVVVSTPADPFEGLTEDDELSRNLVVRFEITGEELRVSTVDEAFRLAKVFACGERQRLVIGSRRTVAQSLRNSEKAWVEGDMGDVTIRREALR